MLFLDATSNADVLAFYYNCAGIQGGAAQAAVTGMPELFAYPPRVTLGTTIVSAALGNTGTAGVRGRGTTYFGPASFLPPYTSQLFFMLITNKLVMLCRSSEN